MDKSIKITNDGSPTLFVPELNEHYHSIHGALQESKHVFIQEGLQYYSEKNKKERYSILEMGLGTHLNCLLSYEFGKLHNLKIDYYGIEKFPIPLPLLFDYYSNFDNNLFEDNIHILENEKVTESNFTLIKNSIDILNYNSNIMVDIVYYDAFAPDKQPELWEVSTFNHLFNLMNENSILVTYCAKGYVKRNLKEAGFQVNAIPGPPGKREMIRATKNI